jgi:hypothetical protein
MQDAGLVVVESDCSWIATPQSQKIVICRFLFKRKTWMESLCKFKNIWKVRKRELNSWLSNTLVRKKNLRLIHITRSLGLGQEILFVSPYFQR